MKRLFLLLTATSLLGLGAGSVTAQDTTIATLIAERQELDEKYKTLSASVRTLQESQELMQKKFEAALAEITALKEKQAKQPANFATQDDLKHAVERLAERIVELDKSRIADNKRVLDNIAELGKTLKVAPPPVAPPSTPKKAANTPARDEKGYEHTVASGDTLSGIVKAYRDEGIKVSQKAIEDANPNVDWNRLRVGAKIWIPAPAE